MALKSQLDNTNEIKQQKVVAKTDKQKTLNAIKQTSTNKASTSTTNTTKADKTNNYKEDSLRDLQNYFSNLSKMTTSKSDLNNYSVKDVYSNYLNKREEEQKARAADPNNNQLVKTVAKLFENKNGYQPDEATQKKQYDIFSGDTTNVRKENADFIKKQAKLNGMSEYDYVKQSKKYANNIKESQDIINKELSNAKTSQDDNIEITLSDGTKVLGSEYNNKVKELNDNFTSLNTAKTELENIYNTKGFTAEQAAQYNSIIEQMNGLVVEAQKYDAVEAGWADFDTRGKEIDTKIKDIKSSLSLAQENGDIQTALSLSDELETLQRDKEANEQRKKDQEAYIISQNFEYVMNNGTAQEKEKYAEYIASRNDNIFQRMYNMGTAAVIGMAASPFNFADLVLERIDEYNGKNDFDPNNPNLISNQLNEVKTRLNEFSLNGTEGTGRFILQSVQSILPFVTTIMTAKAMGIKDGINAVSTLAQGFQVGAETAKQDIAEGKDLASAELHGTLMGAISTLTEAIGGEGFIDMISGNAVAGLLGDGVLQRVNWLDVIRIINKSSLAEGVEEVMEDVGDRAANTLLNRIAANSTTLQNTDFEDFSNLATSEGLYQYAGDMATSFIMAYVGSVITGAGTTIPGAVQNNAVYNYLTSDMTIQTQAQFDLAVHLKEQLAQGIKFNTEEIANLTDEETIAKKTADSEAAQRAINALDSLMRRYSENSITKDRIILLNDKNNIPTVEQSYGTLIEGFRNDISETIDLTNELATNTAIATKLTEQALEQRNIKVSTEEWNTYSKEQQSSISYTSRSLQKLGITDFSIEPMADDTNGLNVNINGKNIIKLNANGNAVDIFTGKELSTAETVKRVAIHELWHRVENTEAGKQLKELLDKEKGMSKVLSALEANDIDDITSEKYAYMLENTLDSEAFISQLVERKGSTLKTVVGDLKALFSKGYNKYFNDVLQKYEAALEEYNNVPEEQKFILEKELKSEKLGISAIKGFREQSVEIAKSTDNYQEIFDKIWGLYQEYGESQTMKNVFANTINRIDKGFYDRAEFEAFNEEIRKNNNVNELSDRLRDLQKQEAQLFNSGADLSNSFAMHKIQYERGAISDRIQQLNDEEALRNRDRTTLEEKALTFEQQIKLNDVSEIAYKLAPNGYYINAHNKSGGTVINGTYTKERLASAVGTTVANEIINKADVTMQRTNNIPKDTSIYEDEANIKEVVKMAKKEYGITNNPNVVGYMLPDGKYLNFGNPGINDNMRVTDHREAPYGMEFMKFGNIRMFPETAGFELIMKPNEKQQKALLNYLKTVKAPYGHFIGISNADMVGSNDIAALTFENGETPKQIMDKVMSYFPEETKFSKKLSPLERNLNEMHKSLTNYEWYQFYNKVDKRRKKGFNYGTIITYSKENKYAKMVSYTLNVEAGKRVNTIEKVYAFKSIYGSDIENASLMADEELGNNDKERYFRRIEQEFKYIQEYGITYSYDNNSEMYVDSFGKPTADIERNSDSAEDVQRKQRADRESIGRDVSKVRQGSLDNTKYSKKLNADYMKAANSNNTEEAQKLVDEAAIEWGALENNGKPINLYHGTNRAGFTSFDMEKSQNAVFLTEAVDTAQSYSGTDNVDTLSNYKNNFDNAETREAEISNLKTVEEANEWISKNVVGLEDTEYQIEHSMGQYRLYSVNDYGKLAMGNLPSIKQAVIYLINNINSDGANMNADHISTSGNYSVYAKMDNPIIVEGDGNYWNDLSVFAKDKNGKTVRFNNEYGDYDDDSLIATRDWCEYANANGYDGVIFKDIVDLGGASDIDEWNTTSANVYAVLNANNIKSADAITYNDNGEVIPLNERFTDNEDMRYSKKLKATKLNEEEQQTKDYMLRELAVNQDALTDNYVKKFMKAVDNYNNPLNDEAQKAAKKELEYYRDEIKNIVGERYDMAGEDSGYDFTSKELKRTMRNAVTLDWETIKKDLPKSSKEQQRIKRQLLKYFTIRSTGGVSPDVLLDIVNEQYDLNIESTGYDMLKDLIDICDSVDTKNSDYIYEGMNSLETMYGFTEAEWDKKFDNLVKDIKQQKIDKTKAKIEHLFDNVDSFVEANKDKYADIKKAQGWIDGVKQADKKLADKDAKATERYDSVKKTFVDNAEKWIPNYEYMANRYSVVTKETLHDALYELLVEGAMSGDTMSKLAGELTADIDRKHNILKEISEFEKDAVKYFAVDAALRDDEKNIKKGITRTINYGEGTFGSAGVGFEENYIKQRTIIDSMNEKEEKRSGFKKKFADIADKMVHFGQDADKANLSHKTLQQVLDKVFGFNTELRRELREVLEGRTNEAHADMMAIYNHYSEQLEGIIKDYGIKGGSKESRLMQYIMEKHTEQKVDGHYVEYNIENLKHDGNYKMANGKMAWENISEAAAKMSNAYENIMILLNTMQLDTYGDVVGEKEYELAQLGAKVRQSATSLLDLKKQMTEAPTPQLQAAIETANRRLAQNVKEYNALAQKLSTGDAARRQFTPTRKNYAHHIQNNTIWDKLKSLKNADDKTPTELAGVTDYNAPNSASAGFMWQQEGGRYTPDAIEGFAAYLKDASRVIAFDSYIFEVRQLENEIKQLDTENNINDFTKWLDMYLNNLAGKRNTMDKGLNDMVINNKALKAAQILVGQAKAATLQFNVHSAIVQIANIPNGLGILNQQKNGMKAFGKGLADFTQSFKKNSESEAVRAMNNSVFLQERYMGVNTENVTAKAKVNEAANWFMGIGDEMGSKIIWLSAYEQGKANIGNATEKQLRDYADDVTRRAVAGRGVGEVPLALQSSVFNLLVPFQVETNNQWQTLKSQISNKQWGAVATSMTAAYIFNAAFKALGAGDVLSEVITPFVEEIKKFRKSKDDDDEDNDITGGQLVTNILMGEVGEVLSMIPGANMLINMAFNKEDSDSILGDYSPSRYGSTNLGAKGLGDIATGVYNTVNNLNEGKYYEALRSGVNTGSDVIKNFVPGGTQAVRTVQGMQSMGALPQLTANGVEITPVNYTDSGKIRYVNDQDNIFDWLKAGAFGKWQTSAAQEYIDSGFKTKSATTTNLFDAIKNNTDNAKDAMDIAESISDTSSLKYADGTTITNSKALQVRAEMEEAGVYDDIVKKINDEEIDPSKYGLSKTVINMNEAEAQKALKEAQNANGGEKPAKKTTKSNSSSTTKTDNSKASNKANTEAKRTGGVNSNMSKKSSSKSSKNDLTKKEQSIYAAISNVTKKLNGGSTKSVNATIANIMSKVSKSGTDTQKQIAALQKKLNNL